MIVNTTIRKKYKIVDVRTIRKQANHWALLNKIGNKWKLQPYSTPHKNFIPSTNKLFLKHHLWLVVLTSPNLSLNKSLKRKLLLVSNTSCLSCLIQCLLLTSIKWMFSFLQIKWHRVLLCMVNASFNRSCFQTL